MSIDYRFRSVADKFFRYFERSAGTGGALAIRLHGEPVLDIWAGWAEKGRPWTADTLALSYSTGKGVVATIANRLIDRGVLDLDSPVAHYWPEFAAEGKAEITVGHLLAHRAGLQGIRRLGLEPDELLDHDRLANALAASRPDRMRYKASGYHGLTFGTLVAEIAQRASGRSLAELIRTELAEPLGESDFYFGVPKSQRSRVAPVPPGLHIARVPVDTLAGPLVRWPIARTPLSAMYTGWIESTTGEHAYDIVMPSWNGVFSARSLATMYSAIAGGGQVRGRRLFTHETNRLIVDMPANSNWDYVLGAGPHWSRGYHRGVVGARISRRAVGHFGFGGSGGVAIPDLGLSIGFVTNQLGNAAMSVADSRLPRLALLAARAAQVGLLGR
ncbi:serine hydrolase domain-containing protein [Nocardia neocaledoniensis]